MVPDMRWGGALLIALVGLAAVGCGSSGLSGSEIKEALEQRPLTYHYRDENYSGDGAAVGGTATDGKATVTFEVVSGNPRIENPIFPQDKNGIDRFQREVNEAGYTLTTNLPMTRAAGERQSPVAVAIETAICERTESCGGPAG
jgi:hypothetical protein